MTLASEIILREKVLVTFKVKADDTEELQLLIQEKDETFRETVRTKVVQSVQNLEERSQLRFLSSGLTMRDELDCEIYDLVLLRRVETKSTLKISEEDQKELIRMRRLGISRRLVAQKLGISRNSVLNYEKVLGI